MSDVANYVRDTLESVYPIKWGINILDDCVVFFSTKLKGPFGNPNIAIVFRPGFEYAWIYNAIEVDESCHKSAMISGVTGPVGVHSMRECCLKNDGEFRAFLKTMVNMALYAKYQHYRPHLERDI